jgi:hypothetical protein
VEQEVERGEQEGRRLAGTCLRLAGNVVAFECEGQRARLDGRTKGKTGVGNALRDLLVQWQFVEPEMA